MLTDSDATDASIPKGSTHGSMEACELANVEKGPDVMKRFIVKAHWASRLHYDLRLEMDGVAKSWAIPKEPLLEPGARRLAIQVGDHSIEDMGHEDLSKERSARSGRVETWDEGKYEILEKDEGRLVLRFNGRKLKGIYGLIRIERWKGNDWLLLRRAERFSGERSPSYL